MGYVFQKDATSKGILVMLRSSASSPVGQGKTGLVYNTAGLKCYYTRGPAGTPTAISLATQTSGGAYSSGGFVEKDATNSPGLYRLDVPNAVLATGVDTAVITFTGGGILDETVAIDLVADDPYAASPTTTQIADSIYTRDLTAVVGAATKSLLNWIKAGGLPLEKVSFAAGVFTVYDNDGVTPVLTYNVTGTPTITVLDKV
jgi:hypothetical protein